MAGAWGKKQKKTSLVEKLFFYLSLLKKYKITNDTIKKVGNK